MIMNARIHRRGVARQAEKGMTLLEIMIVIALLGVVATLVVGKLSGSLENGKISTTRLKVIELGKKVMEYQVTVGEYPSSSEGLKALVNPPGGFSGLLKRVPKDPWGNEFVYREGKGDEPFEIFSLGPDGNQGTRDDIYQNVKREN